MTQSRGHRIRLRLRISDFLARKFSKLLAKTLDRYHASFATRIEQQKFLTVLQQHATSDSAQYVYEHLAGALLFPTREELWDHAVDQVRGMGNFAEFGVHEGHSIRHLATKIKDKGWSIYGFDSFEGLREDWSGTTMRKGYFSVAGSLPPVPDNVTLIKGWFDETLPEFMRLHSEDFAFLHIDVDTYEAARTVLTLVGNRIKPGTVIVFDEYHNYPGWRHGEWKAWKEFVEKNGIRYRYIGFSTAQVALLVH